MSNRNKPCRLCIYQNQTELQHYSKGYSVCLFLFDKSVYDVHIDKVQLLWYLLHSKISPALLIGTMITSVIKTTDLHILLIRILRDRSSLIVQGGAVIWFW